jgi:hypothetical protein
MAEVFFVKAEKKNPCWPIKKCGEGFVSAKSFAHKTKLAANNKALVETIITNAVPYVKELAASKNRN